MLADQYLRDKVTPPTSGDHYIIVDSAVTETDSGWFFPYQTARFLEEKDINYSVVGNWPIFVTKTGKVLGPLRQHS